MRRKLTTSFELTEAYRAGDVVYSNAEANANSFNLTCLAFITVLAILADILNELGLFKVDRSIMVPVIVASSICFLLPIVVYLVHDSALKKTPSILASPKLKVLIITCAYIGTTMVATALSLHAVILLAVPPLMAAQYPYSRKLVIGVLFATLVMVPITVYGSFVFGSPDRNFIKGQLTDQEAQVIANRLQLVTSQRMVEITFHYLLPRLFGIALVGLLALGISKRNERMLDNQTALMKVARDEMERRSSLQNKVIEDLAGVIETRDVGTGEHVIRTKRYVGVIARELQRRGIYADELTDQVISEMEAAAPLHDVGKIAISDSILLKPGKLTDEEFEIMKSHSTKGGEMVRRIFENFGDAGFLDEASNIAAHHHEKWDGSGYPDGLKREQIPIEARIMAVADVYDALTSERVYKDAMTPDEAFAILQKDSGTHFDPMIIDVVMDIKDDFVKAGILHPEETGNAAPDDKS